MIRNLLVLLMCLGISSCAYNEYAGIYKNALKTGTSVTITREENYQELKERVAGYFESRGYKNIIFTDRGKNFIVLSKKGDFDLDCHVILKYTEKVGVDKTRVDMVNGNDDLVANSEVSDDIKAIAERIKNE